MQGTESNGPSVKASAVPAPAATNSRFADISGFVNTVGIGNLLLAIVFGIAAVVLVNDPANGGGVAAAVLAQALTLPILLAKVAPALAAGALTTGVLQYVRRRWASSPAGASTRDLLRSSIELVQRITNDQSHDPKGTAHQS